MAIVYTYGPYSTTAVVASTDTFLFTPTSANNHDFNFTGLPAGYNRYGWPANTTFTKSAGEPFPSTMDVNHGGVNVGFWTPFGGSGTDPNGTTYTGTVQAPQRPATTQYFFPALGGGSDVFNISNPFGCAVGASLNINSLSVAATRGWKLGNDNANTSYTDATGAGGTATFNIYAQDHIPAGGDAYVSGAYYRWDLYALSLGILATYYPWLHFSQVTGTDQATIMVTVDPNTSGGSRFAQIYIVPNNDTAHPNSFVIFTINQPVSIAGTPLGTDPLSLSLDRHNEIVLAAWSPSGFVNVAGHHAVHAYIGSGSSGWEATQQIEAANGTDTGVVYLPSGRAYLSYALSMADEYRVNDLLGYGPAANWSALRTPGGSGSGIAACGRAQGLAWKVRVDNASAIYFATCRDQAGAVWSPDSGVTMSVQGNRCGAAFLGGGYGVLWTDGTGAIRWTFSRDAGLSWASPATIAALGSYQVAAIAFLRSSVIVGLLWNTTTNAIWGCRSRDLGTTWELDGSAITVFGTLSSPPQLVEDGSGGAIAVYVNGLGNPVFLYTSDGGLTWR